MVLFDMFKQLTDTFLVIILGTKEVTPRAPHIVDNLEIKRYMTMVIIALMPSTITAIYYFRMKAVMIILVSYVAGGLAEVVFTLIRKKEINEGFLVTGLIFPLTLPPGTPLWVVAVGSIFGVIFGKELFGGTGRNIFNPALVGRLFITIAFPSIMTSSWLMPFSDAVTSATPLVLYKTSHTLLPYMDLLLGKCAGSMGETFRIGIIAGGIFLIITKVSNYRIPFAYLASVALFAWLGSTFFPGKVAPLSFQLLSGGLLYGAMFMATDPVTSPFTRAGKFTYGILLGFLTVLIRSFSGYVEGVMFSIIMMNAFTPLIDSIVLSIKYKPVSTA